MANVKLFIFVVYKIVVLNTMIKELINIKILLKIIIKCISNIKWYALKQKAFIYKLNIDEMSWSRVQVLNLMLMRWISLEFKYSPLKKKTCN